MSAAIDQAVGVVRQMAIGLHPLILDNLGLRAALDWLAHDATTRLGLDVEFHVDVDDREVAAPSALAIYRLAETATAHLAQHAGRAVAVDVLQRPFDVVLQFRRAKGDAQEEANADEFAGLAEILQDQVHLLGGRVEAGRRVMVFLPMKPA
mgnify:CR=1 FL=1